YLEMLEKSVLKLKTTLNDQVDHLRENQLLKPGVEQVILKEVLGNIIDSLGTIIQNTGTKFEIQFSEIEVLQVNKFYLHSIFLNLITNSIKYSKPNIAPIISIVSKRYSSGTHIEYSDNGIGMDLEENGNNLFELHEVFTEHHDSKGIGLFLVKSYMNSL